MKNNPTSLRLAIVPLCMLVLLAFSFAAFAQTTEQHIRLNWKKWNAIYLQVTPTINDADTVFANWPVNSVALYDNAAFTRTAQANTAGDFGAPSVAQNSYLVWHRGHPELSTLNTVVGGYVYVCYSTLGLSYYETIYGVPTAPRMNWHPASLDGTVPLNFLGVAVDEGFHAPTTAYLRGMPAGVKNTRRIGGTTKEAFELLPLESAFSNGFVVVADAQRVSDWAGPLFISPANGINFGTNDSMSSFSIRNDSGTNMTVRVTYTLSKNDGSTPVAPLLPLNIEWTNGWQTIGNNQFVTLEMEPGAKREVRVGFNRAQLTTNTHAGILSFRDFTAGTHFKASIPVMATRNPTTAQGLWPVGLWVGTVQLNAVDFFRTDTQVDHGIKAGSPMNLRILLHVTSNNVPTLLQHVHRATDGKEERLYMNASNIPAGWESTRISTVGMGLDAPRILADSGKTFGSSNVTFRFTVGAKDRGNPFRHPYHPSHDGLQWDFKTPAPDGDNIQNYQSTIKPETFSVSNTLSLSWSPLSGVVWNPQERVSGTAIWSLGGLRKGPPIQCNGTFSLQRTSPIATLR